MESNKYCVLMAGGAGTRFWPRSRQSMPKQFLDILGTGKSFLRHTFERFEKLVPVENFMVVTHQRYKELVMQHLPELSEDQILCEPIGRNTAPCIAYAAFTLLRRNPEAEMIVTPSDHLILNEEDFRSIIGECVDFAAEHDALVTVGIKPTRPRPFCSAASSSGIRASSSGRCGPSSRPSAATCPSTTRSSAA